MIAAMCTRLFLLLAIIAIGRAFVQGATEEAWESFKRQYGRQYGPEEEAFRRRVFADNLALIGRHNAEFAAGRSAYQLGVNQFADLTGAEFGRLLLAGRPAAPLAASSRLSGPPPPDPPPAEFDWRAEGVPIRIRDQGQTGGWTIPVLTTLEAGVYIADGGRMTSLSRQNLLDCTTPLGAVSAALEYVRDHGLADETDYPWTGRRGTCRDDAPVAVTVEAVQAVPAGNETALQQALLTIPVPVIIDASHPSFQLYSSGIYSDPACSARNLDHAVMLVGYGNASSTGFWTLANSWGVNWGERGFMRMERGANMCGVASAAAYPTGVMGV